jgi:mannose/cellobiose epimerase-like protein (N-acyl-D-glucosamine 2-epimerase family)
MTVPIHTLPTTRLPAMPVPDFGDPRVLRAHIADTMAFYHPRAIDPDGGFFHYFRDDGSVYDARHRHLVSSTRFVYDYAMAAREFPESPLAGEYRAATVHGLRYLRDAHRDPGSGAYAWTLCDGVPEDRTRHAYGMAFVLLAYASGRKAGIDGSGVDTAAWMDETRELLESRFWDANAGLYRDEADEHWQFSGYRGQNANMHLCEAHLAAFEASGDAHDLDRALLLADHMTRRQAALAGGLVWEHYDRDWNIDWDYNRENPKHLFRPWGFQPGHQVEWAKLLLTLRAHLGARGEAPAWLLPTARQLFDTALRHAWDEEFGGIAYGFAPDGTVCDDDKYFWVQAEAIAAAWRLHEATGATAYRDWYDRIWAYCWEHFVDHRHGAWYRILDRRNAKYGDEKSPAGKTDYHTMGACHDVLAVMRADPANGTNGANR